MIRIQIRTWLLTVVSLDMSLPLILRRSVRTEVISLLRFGHYKEEALTDRDPSGHERSRATNYPHLSVQKGSQQKELATYAIVIIPSYLAAHKSKHESRKTNHGVATTKSYTIRQEESRISRC